MGCHRRLPLHLQVELFVNLKPSKPSPRQEERGTSNYHSSQNSMFCTVRWRLVLDHPPSAELVRTGCPHSDQGHPRVLPGEPLVRPLLPAFAPQVQAAGFDPPEVTMADGTADHGIAIRQQNNWIYGGEDACQRPACCKSTLLGVSATWLTSVRGRLPRSGRQSIPAAISGTVARLYLDRLCAHALGHVR